MTSQRRVLVLTLRTDENEFEQSVASLEAQTHSNWEHVVFTNLPNKEAHDALYATIMRRGGEFGLFVKLDADMVFRDSQALARLVDMFDADAELDHVQSAVHDWYTDSPMMGLHAYTPRCRWSGRDEQMFVDYRPEFPGHRIDLTTPPAPFVLHGPDPSPYQAYLFGVHRANKVYQYDRLLIRRGEARSQWRNLERVAAHYQRSGDRRLGLLLLGAEDVRDKVLSPDSYDIQARAAVRERFEERNRCSDEEIRQMLSTRWLEPARHKRRWLQKLVLRDRLTWLAKKIGMETP